MMHNYDNKEFVYDFLKLCWDYDLQGEMVTIRYSMDEPEFWVDCSDLHVWGAAYGVKVTPSDLPLLRECLDYNEIEGHLLFCCKVYGLRPQGAYYTHLEPNMWLAFDMCGDYRKSGLGNPHRQKFTNETLEYNLEHFANEMFEDFTYPYLNYKKLLVVG